MKDYIDKLKEFNTAFEVERGQQRNIRYKLMQEENNEYLWALNNNNDIEVADAIGDMLYILCGTIVEHGLEDKIEAIFNEIHSSNMSKLENGKVIRREDGKILKGKNYFKPNLKKILDE